MLEFFSNTYKLILAINTVSRRQCSTSPSVIMHFKLPLHFTRKIAIYIYKHNPIYYLVQITWDLFKDFFYHNAICLYQLNLNVPYQNLQSRYPPSILHCHRIYHIPLITFLPLCGSVELCHILLMRYLFITRNLQDWMICFLTIIYALYQG